MYSADFDYYRAGSLQEALGLLSEHPDAKLLAGGHSLIPLIKLRLSRPTALIDIGGIGALRGVNDRDGSVHIGPLTTHAEIASSTTLQATFPMLCEAAAVIGDPQVRSRGTIGGNVVHADPASDLPTVLAALGASYSSSGPSGDRTIGQAEFFQGVMTTALAENEVLTSVNIPHGQAGQGTAYVKFPHPASRYAVLGAAVVLTVSGGRCQHAAVSVGGLVPTPVRAVSVENALTGQSLTTQVIADAAQLVSNDLGDDVLGDIFASAEYRRAMAPVYLEQALTTALERATG